MTEFLHCDSRTEPKTTVWTEGSRSFLGLSNKQTRMKFAFTDQKEKNQNRLKRRFLKCSLILRNETLVVKSKFGFVYFKDNCMVLLFHTTLEEILPHAKPSVTEVVFCCIFHILLPVRLWSNMWRFGHGAVLCGLLMLISGETASSPSYRQTATVLPSVVETSDSVDWWSVEEIKLLTPWVSSESLMASDVTDTWQKHL